MAEKTSQATNQGTFAALVNRMGEIEPLLDKERFIVSDVDEIDRHLVRWLKHKGVVYATDTRVKRGPSKKREVAVWEWKHTVREELKEYREDQTILDCGHRPHVYHHPEQDCLTCKFCAENDHYPEYERETVGELL